MLEAARWAHVHALGQVVHLQKELARRRSALGAIVRRERVQLVWQRSHRRETVMYVPGKHESTHTDVFFPSTCEAIFAGLHLVQSMKLAPEHSRHSGWQRSQYGDAACVHAPARYSPDAQTDVQGEQIVSTTPSHPPTL